MHHAEAADPDSDCACTTLRKATRAVTRMYDDAMAQTGMSIVQFSILRAIARHGSVPLMQLANQMVMERTTLYRALKPIEARGWVAIADTDGRAKLASLTQAGRDAVAEATGAWETAESMLRGRIGAGEWTRIEASLSNLVAVAKERAT
jgi:DNA-binding MarR family transcriptional regulator